jgi:hypothetical protein
MTTFIADFIFGKRDRRPRSRPSPAERLMDRLRPPAPPQEKRPPDPLRIDTGPALSRRPVPEKDARPGLRP